MVPECTNNSRKTVGISYYRIPKEKGFREAWLVRIRRVNPRKINNSCFVRRILHQTASKERSIDLVPGYQKRPKLKSNAVPSIFPRSKPEKARSTGEEEIKSALNKPDKRY